MFERIIVVCTGNICRSPSGEFLLRKTFPNKTITSAGIHVDNNHLVGKPADALASQVALAHQIDLSSHQAQQLTLEHCQQNDLILVMEQYHLDVITNRYPQVRGKIMRFSHWLNDSDIPDPYRQSIEAYEHVWHLLAKSADLWLEKI